MHPDNSLTTEQWGGVGLVFGGLGMKLSHEAYGRQKKKKQKSDYENEYKLRLLNITKS